MDNTAQTNEESHKTEKEITTTRIINANKKLVFKAWTDPEHLKNWWGQHGYTTTFYQFDLRPKGVWSFVMRGPDGSNQPNECTFVAINPPDFISWDHLMNPRFRTEVSFETITENSTKVVYTIIFETVEECKKMKTFVGSKNEETLDRLVAELKNVR